MNSKHTRKGITALLAAVMIVSVLAVMPAAQADPGLVTADLNSGLTPTDLVNMLLGGGVTVSNISYSGINHAAGTFSGGTGIIGFEDGIILSTGNIADVVGPNTADATTTDNSMPGDADLNTLISGYTTFDATVLEFDFVPTTNVVTFEYVFGSEEYNEYVNTQYNNVFGFFINGNNVAMIPGTTTPVAINNVNGGGPTYGDNPSNPTYYINNDCQDCGCSINTELDGLTVVLTVIANVNAGQTNHIKLAIADAGDAVLDSDVFIKAESLFAPSLSLAPLTATNPTGTPHSLTATATQSGFPEDGVLVTFQVISGPHVGTTGFAVTNASGQATWSYSGTTAGMDTIVATATIAGSSKTTNNAFKTWGVLFNPPVANAGPDQTVEQAYYQGADVLLDGSGSSDPDGDPLTYSWTWAGGSATGVSPTVSLPLGETIVTLVVNDSTVDSAPDTVVITVVDTTAPEITCLADVTVEQETAAGTVVPLTATATDICDADVLITSDEPAIYPLGMTVVTFTATDDSGNSATCTTTVTVEDTTPPDISVTVSPDMLWPPNHKMVDIVATVTVSDICDAAPTVVLTSVTSDEPDNTHGTPWDADNGASGDGNTDNDIQGNDTGEDYEFQLRAERCGTEDGRTYTIIYTVTDESGNTADASATVVVPHDME